MLTIEWKKSVNDVLSQDHRIERIPEPETWEGCKGLLGIPRTEIGRIPVSCWFVFDNEKTQLGQVTLQVLSNESTMGDAFEILEWMISNEYGAPDELEDQDIFVLRSWSSEIASVTLIMMTIPGASSISVNYKPPENTCSAGGSLTLKYLGNRTPEVYLDPLRQVVHQHISALSRKYSQTCCLDEYGVKDSTQWVKEIDYFLDRVALFPKLPELRKVAREFISLEVNSHSERARESECISSFTGLDKLDPIAFEQACVDALQRHGWAARRTKATGDQGIDIVAVREGIRVAIQCKRYSQPVGNSAVQEAIAGMVFDRADRACVVSNNSFTASARQLAQAANVVLLHFDDLHRLWSAVSVKGG